MRIEERQYPKKWGENAVNKNTAKKQARYDKYLDGYNLSYIEREKFERASHWCELPVENIESYSDEFRENYSEEQEAKQEYQRKLLYSAINKLTPRQRQIVELYLLGKTETETAKLLGVGQSGISLHWKGVKNYTDYGVKGKNYGGIIYKLQVLTKQKEKTKRVDAGKQSRRGKAFIDKMRQLIKEGKTHQQISDQLGVAIGTVNYHCKGESIHHKRDISYKAILALKEQGKTNEQIAELLGVSVATIRRCKIPIKQKAGGKANEVTAAKIAELKAEGKTVVEIAKELKIAVATVYNYLRRNK